MIIYDTVLVLVTFIGSVLLFVAAGYAEKLITNKWRICYCVPAVFCLMVMGIAGFERCMICTYAACVVPLAGFIWDNKKVRRIASAIAAVLAIVSYPICENFIGYRLPDFSQDFIDSFQVMRRHYVLAEHKNIDWDALYEEYLPVFEEADAKGDKLIAYAAWQSFCGEFHDGHVGFVPANDDKLEKAVKGSYGNDYGLALMSLSDGRVAAVNVEPDSALTQAGIHNGTIITSWDGKHPVEVSAQSSANAYLSYADKDNEAFYNAILAAGVGGDTVEVEFIDDNGEQRSVTLEKISDDYYTRITDALDIIHRGVEVGNMDWSVIDENTVCLRIKSMMYDSDSAESNNYERMKGRISGKVEEFKQQGYTNLVIDLRSNGGGSGDMVKAIAELFAPVGEHYYATDGLWDDEKGCYVYDPETGKYGEGTKNYFTGENVWNGNPIVLLVNAYSASAADHLAEVMRGMDNVTVMGFTESNGSAQGVTGYYTDSGLLGISGSLLLDENGDVYIDSGTDMESGNDIDIRVPFDQTAINVLFNDDEDYLMQKAIEVMAE